MSANINDFTAFNGPYLATDYVLVYRASLALGSRDAKAELNQFVTLDDTQSLSNKTLVAPVITGGATVSGTASFGSTLAVTGIITPTGGVAAAGGFGLPTVFHSGGAAPASETTGTDTTPVVTETYIAEVFVPANCTLTGVSILNGSAVAGNIKISLATSAGVPIAAAVTASAVASGTAAYQKVPFAVAYAAKGPAKYLILLQCDNTGYRFRSHAVGNFGASKKTAEVYGTFTTVTPPTTFTTGLGPIADTY